MPTRRIFYQTGVKGEAINGVKNDYLSLLTPEQRQYAYQTGVVDGLMERGRKNSSGEANADQDQNAAETESKQSKEEKDTPAFLDEGKVNEAQAKVDAAKRSDGKKKKGAVIYDGDRSKLSDMQKKSLDVLDKVAEALGVTFRIYESERVNGRFVYKMPDGVVKSANGWYDPKTGEIWLDINAGLNGEGTLIFTAAHELTHFIKQWSPAKFKIFADFLIEQYGERGISIDELVQRRIDKAKKKGEDIDPDTAYEEVIADSCETFLRDSNAAEKIAELHQKDASLAQKIKQFLSGMLKRLRELMKGMDPDSLEGKVVAEMTESLEQLHKLWTDALADAGEAYSGAESVANSEGGVKEQAREYDDKNLYKDGEVYSYDFMTSQPPMEVRTLPSLSTVKENGKVSQEKAVSLGLDNAKSIGKSIGEKQATVINKYTGREITIGQKSLNHSLDASQIHRLRTNARLSSIGGYIVQNAIPINGLKKENPQANGTYAMACLLKDGEGYVVAIVTVDEFSSNAVGIDFVEITHSINGRFVKKEDSRSSTRESELGQKSISATATFDISIADFLEIVNSSHQSILSDDVLAHFDVERNPSGHYSNRVLFSDRDPDALTNREILANLLETEDMSPSEKGFLTKYKNKIAQIEANEAEISSMEAELKELRKAGKKDSSRAIMLEGKIEARRKEIARDENMILNLESTNSIKRLLKSEKDAAYAEGMLAGQMAQGKDDAAKLRRAEERLADQKRRSDETLAEYKKRVAEREADIKQKNREKLAEQKRQARQDVEDAHLAGQMAQGRIDAAKLATAKRALDEQAKRYQESRKKATEGRHKTAMRHKIAGVVSELDKLLRKGTKERNVKIGLQDAVASALELFDMNEEKVERYNKAIADLDARIAATTDPVEIEALTALREKKVRNGERLADKLQVMKKAYEDIHNGRDGENYPSYYKAECEAIENRIAEVMEKVGDTSIGEMSLEQLEAVYGMYRMVLTTVQNANKVFKNGKLADLTADAADMTSELQRIKKLAEERLKAGDDIRSFVWNELTPYYAFNRIGSETLMSYYEELIRGQDVYARDIEEAQSFAEATRKKHGYGKWKLDQVHSFKDKDGRDFRLTLRHMMSIYAYSKREQAFDHMEKGGFFFNNKETFRKKAGVLEFIASNESGYKVDARIFAQIKGTLTAEQIAYVDEMQAYLTKMGDKGNEVTRVMWGIDIFKEAVYFPLKSKEDFIYQANTPAETSSLKNDGMTKETRPHASNPIVLESFDDVWANHVEKMSKYHGFVIPIDNLNKLINYGTWVEGKKITPGMSDAERYDALKDRVLSLSARANNDTLVKAQEKLGLSDDDIEYSKYGDKKRLFKKLGDEFSIYQKYSNEDIHLDFTFSKGNMGESVSKQGRNFLQMAKMLTCLDEIVDNAIGIEVHNRNQDGYKADNTLENVYVLASSFVDGENIVPVKLEIKKFSDKENTLYVAIALESIKIDGIVKQEVAEDGVAQQYSPPSNISIAQFFEKINIADKSFLKYIPDGFLNPVQIEAKKQALEKDGVKYSPSSASDLEGFSMGSHSISTMLEARFGPGVNEYLTTFIKDLNGAKAQSGGLLGSAFNLLSKFKKTSVAASCNYTK